MAKKRRLKKEVISPNLVTFRTFFDRCVMQNKLKPYQFDEILAHFKANSYSDKDTIENYEFTLKLY